MAKVYYASPDIFRPDWPERAAFLLRLAQDHGIEIILPVPASPLNGIGATLPGTKADAEPIFQDCVHHATTCDAVIANLTPFGSREPDSGTVVEATLAYGRGIPVIGYVDHAQVHKGELDSQGALRDAHGNLVEQFGLPCNLMVAGVCRVLVDHLDRAFAEAAKITGSDSTWAPSP